MNTLHSTSSTLAKYRCGSAGKSISQDIGSPRSLRGIEDELDSLFGDEYVESSLSYEPNNPELSRITEEIEELLLW